jgi:glycosyltransferase involved in cell wall biosynthesis
MFVVVSDVVLDILKARLKLDLQVWFTKWQRSSKIKLQVNNLNKVIDIIVPAYNEQERIPKVLEAICPIGWVNQVIVVDDCSTDETSKVARSFPVKLISHLKNSGKGAALQSGIKASQAEILVFIDADLTGLRAKHLETLVKPLLSQPKLAMTIGCFTKGRISTNLSQRIAPILNGQRALKREFIDLLPDLSPFRFGVEVFLSKYALKLKLKTLNVSLEGLAQVLKEEKNGFWRGVAYRCQMYYQIIKLWWQFPKLSAKLEPGACPSIHDGKNSEGKSIGKAQR